MVNSVFGCLRLNLPSSKCWCSTLYEISQAFNEGVKFARFLNITISSQKVMNALRRKAEERQNMTGFSNNNRTNE